jgi:hypothetical protein
MTMLPDLSESERRNLLEVERLNQRGGRTLSIVDLVAAGTLTAEMAALAWLLISDGASFLTGAVPGGAGKTTLMGALLSFLPPGEPVVTVGERRVLEDALEGRLAAPATVLAHEIGAGRWFGYLWGRDAVDFLSLHRRGLRRVCCLHADAPEEARAALRGLGVSCEDFGHMILQFFMRVHPGRRGPVRRVSAMHCLLGRELRLLYRWDPERERFAAALDRAELSALVAGDRGGSPEQVAARWGAYERCLEGLESRGVRTLSDVRRGVLASYSA